MQDQRYESNYMFPRRMLFFHANRSALLIRGLIFLVLGLIGLFRPIGSLAAVTIILGIILLIDSAGALFLSIACRRFFGILWSLLLCAAGVAMIVRPLEADTLVVIVLGVWLIVTGAGELLSVQVSSRKTILSGSGILSILIGVLLAAAPFVGLTAVSWLVALLLLGFVLGLLRTYGGDFFSLRTMKLTMSGFSDGNHYGGVPPVIALISLGIQDTFSFLASGFMTVLYWNTEASKKLEFSPAPCFAGAVCETAELAAMIIFLIVADDIIF